MCPDQRDYLARLLVQSPNRDGAYPISIRSAK